MPSSMLMIGYLSTQAGEIVGELLGASRLQALRAERVLAVLDRTPSWRNRARARRLLAGR